ncbi:DUF4102 domain-containing protein [Seongchinamella unica]|uniref:DUF4102 domain-containing protein n=1 Tax=Seongchinamella unica TaxID=2547392 RepID=A0A4R5LSX8_9GAMM|nr:integrase arm-type DNA-binding domain-containing protein [Seongchinamella unica]TDG13966.1 DUF4102 domain-containing protein [Seongchinamella unica]
MPKSLNFTKAALENIDAPERGRLYIHDTKIPSLGIAVTDKGSKSFYVRGTVGGKTKRVTLGRFPAMKVEQARKQAKKKLSEMVDGVDPIKEKRAERAAENVSELTVKQAVEVYLKEKRKGKQKLPLKDSTKDSYRDKIKYLLGDDYEEPLVSITEELIAKKIADITPSQGATGCRSLSAVWNWTRKRKGNRGLIPENPVRLWSEDNDGLYVPPPRKGHIRKEYLEDWFNAVEAQKHGDCLAWLILTGNRLEEARGLEWADFDFRTGLYTLRDTKNRTEVELPIPEYFKDKLKKRKSKEKTGPVFTMPAQNSRIRTEITKAAELPERFTNHDLRRTFATIGRTVCDHTMVKQLMNHLISDITFDYSQLDGSDLAQQLRKIEAAILEHAGRPLPSENVVKLEVVG